MQKRYVLQHVLTNACPSVPVRTIYGCCTCILHVLHRQASYKVHKANGNNQVSHNRRTEGKAMEVGGNARKEFAVNCNRIIGQAVKRIHGDILGTDAALE
jgi:hypothetical protein